MTGQMEWNILVEKTAELIDKIDQTIHYLHVQDYLHGMMKVTELLDQFVDLLPEYIAHKDYYNAGQILIEEQYVLGMLQDVLSAKEQGDNVLLADLLELQFLPFLQSLQERIILEQQAPDTGVKGYVLEYTSSGAYTLVIEQGDRRTYLHTNGNVYREARELAASWFRQGQFQYTVYGIGLGYHIQALLDMDEAIKVTVIESDKNRISIAKKYGVPGLFDKITVCDTLTGKSLQAAVQQESGSGELLVHYPSVCSIEDTVMRKQLEEYFYGWTSISVQLTRLLGNFHDNQPYFEKEVGELREQFAGKTCFVIAAGPSLDHNMQELKRVSDGGVILATGTVLRKLLAQGIRPDYVIVTDAGAGTYRQIEGVQECGVPLLFMATVYHKIVQDYQAEKYAIFQEGFPASEECAAEHGYGMTETGGSVATTAASLGVRLGCSEIVFCGLDLAYTGGKAHAAQTDDTRDVTNTAVEWVEDIHGQKIPTARNLNSYRKWIEQYIAKHPEINFIDATEGGAKIQGAVLQKLADVVDRIG